MFFFFDCVYGLGMFGASFPAGARQSKFSGPWSATEGRSTRNTWDGRGCGSAWVKDLAGFIRAYKGAYKGGKGYRRV